MTNEYDLVRRLRYGWFPQDSARLEAADEIERLRAELAAAKDLIFHSKDGTRADHG